MKESSTRVRRIGELRSQNQLATMYMLQLCLTPFGHFLCLHLFVQFLSYMILD